MIIVFTEAAAELFSSQKQNRAHGAISCSTWITDQMLAFPVSGEAGRLRKFFAEGFEIQI